MTNQDPFHRNQYMEGARRMREKPLISIRFIGGLILFSLFVLLAFLYFVTESTIGLLITQLGEELRVVFLSIGGVIILALGVGMLLGLIRGRRKEPLSFMQTASKSVSDDQRGTRDLGPGHNGPEDLGAGDFGDTDP